MKYEKAKLFLIPTPISADGNWILSTELIQALKSCTTLVCERIRTTRRLIKQYYDQESFDALHFIEIDKHDQRQYVEEALQKLEAGEHVAVLSEAGMPCIADPGYRLVLAAQKKNVMIEPLVGPCSFVMALAASGLDGQAFTFHGYLPRQTDQLYAKLREIEQSLKQSGVSQLFMETPYRNQKLFESVLAKVSDHLYLSVALDITGQNQQIRTTSIAAWKKKPMRFDEKYPAVFTIGKGN